LDDTSHASDTLDGPPHVSDDFEWNEQHVVEGRNSESGLSPEKSNTSEDVEEESIAMDGMASLTIGDSEGGYLGASSGAAMLRLIDPRAANASTPRKKSSRVPSDRVSRGDETWPEVLYEQPDPNRHIVDTMIDAYFGLYHISFPIVHEPTFRAQYSELIERPNGDCWKFLAYVVAAVGVFTTTSAGDDSDMALFAHAKSLMHMSYLESGNLTLIQALGLMSNYLQRKDMPNSGYNYLGLASRMAMGLGLHKEFPGWKIQPLKMETRRRVWWCLAIFDIGATITYGRPVSWPAGGIDVSLPLNIDDRVSSHKPSSDSMGH
jgi:transcriptional regulatory protein GAL4